MFASDIERSIKICLDKFEKSEKSDIKCFRRQYNLFCDSLYDEVTGVSRPEYYIRGLLAIPGSDLHFLNNFNILKNVRDTLLEQGYPEALVYKWFKMIGFAYKDDKYDGYSTNGLNTSIGLIDEDYPIFSHLLYPKNIYGYIEHNTCVFTLLYYLYRYNINYSMYLIALNKDTPPLYTKVFTPISNKDFIEKTKGTMNPNGINIKECRRTLRLLHTIIILCNRYNFCNLGVYLQGQAEYHIGEDDRLENINNIINKYNFKLQKNFKTKLENTVCSEMKGLSKKEINNGLDDMFDALHEVVEELKPDSNMNIIEGLKSNSKLLQRVKSYYNLEEIHSDIG